MQLGPEGATSSKIYYHKSILNSQNQMGSAVHKSNHVNIGGSAQKAKSNHPS